MGYAEDANLGETERILLAMHNLSIVRAEIAWTVMEIGGNVAAPEENIVKSLNELESAGYVKSYKDSQGSRRYYLTSRGIIKISTLFT